MKNTSVKRKRVIQIAIFIALFILMALSVVALSFTSTDNAVALEENYEAHSLTQTVSSLDYEQGSGSVGLIECTIHNAQCTMSDKI